MWIRIDSNSGLPIYRQIAAQIQQAVLSGVLRGGDKLPGVRELAVELAVNPATIAKAYEELQEAGVIEQPRGRGTFVLGRPTLGEAQRASLLRDAVDSLLREAERLGFTAAEALAELRKAMPSDETPQHPDREGERHAGG